MAGDRHFTRIDTVEMRIQLVKKLGNQKAEKYFNLLNKLFALKLNKSEFDKLCIAAIGRENLGLHNCFVRSIIKNASLAKTPPLRRSKLEIAVHGTVPNGYQMNCIQSLCRDALSPSPRKCRTLVNRNKKFKDRPSPLGPHGKPQPVSGEETATPKIQESATELLSLGSRPLEVNSVEDGEEVDQAAAGSPGSHSRSPVTAPLGVPWNVKGMRKVLVTGSLPSTRMETCLRNRELPDTISLRKRLEQKLEKEGLKASLDSMNLLNNGLDVFLRRLIKPCIDLAALLSANKQQSQVVVQTISGANGIRYVRRETRSFSASVLDFQNAMELNPTILGEDWPLQLEKVCLRESEN